MQVDDRSPGSFRLKVWTLRLCAIAALVGLWAWMTASGSATSILLPGPIATAQALRSLLVSAELWENLWVTVVEIICAFLAATVLALLLAMIAARSRFWGSVVEPMLGWAYMVPQVIFFPLFVLWFGIGPSSKIIFAAVGAFFPLGLAAVRAIRSVEPRFVRVGRAFGASQVQIDATVRWRSALPLFVSGLRVSAALCLILVILAEMLAANAGLGYLLTRATQLYRGPESLALVIIIVALAGTLYLGISQVGRSGGTGAQPRRRRVNA